jgi:hypothetical protein
MNWIDVACWAAATLILICVAIVVICEVRDRANRGMRVSNGQVYRERVTKTLPDNWLRDFHERDYK